MPGHEQVGKGSQRIDLAPILVYALELLFRKRS